MSFTEWIFLLGGFAVAGPMIAHLLAKPRFRRLPFTMLRFLRTGQIQSQSRRKLRDLLILLLRCAIIVLIAMLFARPIIHLKHEPEQTKHTFCLGLDNSMSMAYTDGDRVFLDRLIDSATDYIRSAEPDSLFNICALTSGDWMQGLSQEQAMAEVKALRIEPARANIGDFLSGLGQTNRTKGSNDESPTRQSRYGDGTTSVLVLSDFTPNTLQQFVQIAEPVAVNKIDYKPIVSTRPVNNAAIVEAHVVSMAEGRLTVSAVVVNYGVTTQNRRLTAKAGPYESAAVDVRLAANQRQAYPLQIEIDDTGKDPSFWPVELSLSEGDGLQADDLFHLGVSIPGHKDINVLLTGEKEVELFLLRTAMDALSRSSFYSMIRVRQVLIGNLGSTDLDWADVIICSGITDRLGYLASSLQDFVTDGGKLVCFMSGSVASEAAKQLWQRDILAALPGRCVRGRTYVQPKPCDNRLPQGMAGTASGVDHAAGKSLSNYRIDKILLKGYLECQPHPESRCLWQLQDGSGFLYLKTLGGGISILVNTSADDSLGSLTKSRASVAFCQYLLGRDNQVGEHCFACDERITLPVADMPTPPGTRRAFWIETCDGKKRRAAVVDSVLLMPDPAGVGWVRTLGEPTLYAGINLPQGETDMRQPDVAELDEIMKRVFPTGLKKSASSADVLGNKKPKTIWTILAWTIILLLLVEPAVTNRLRR